MIQYVKRLHLDWGRRGIILEIRDIDWLKWYSNSKVLGIINEENSVCINAENLFFFLLKKKA